MGGWWYPHHQDPDHLSLGPSEAPGSFRVLLPEEPAQAIEHALPHDESGPHPKGIEHAMHVSILRSKGTGERYAMPSSVGVFPVWRVFHHRKLSPSLRP